MTNSRKNLLIITLFSFALLILGNGSINITDPVESNYTLTSLEMLDSGDFISPRIYGNYWFDKPVFFYWELIAAFSLLGVNEFAARLCPAIFGVLGAVMTYFFARRIYDEKTGFWSAVILTTCFEYWIISKTVITDSTLFVFFNAVLACFYVAYTSENKNWYYLCYVFAGLAVLTKGPIGILLPGLIVTIFILVRRDFKEILRMKPLGFVLFFIVAGSWYYAMYRLHGQQFLDMFLGVHNYLRATVSEHPMWDIWYYYSVLFLLAFFPWTFVVIPSLIRKYWKERMLPSFDVHEQFLLIWALTINIFYQNMATKYSTYTLPALMPVAILAARFLYNRETLLKRMFAFNIVLYVCLTFFVAIPMCNTKGYSGKDIAVYLNNNVPKEATVAFYGDYETSIVFYSRRTVYLTAGAERIEKMRPKAMSWNMKNIMPLKAIEDLPKDKPVYLVLHRKYEWQFPKEFNPAEWETLEKFAKCSVLVRKPK